MTGDLRVKLIRVSAGITAGSPRVASTTPVPAPPPTPAPMAAPLPPPAMAPTAAPIPVATPIFVASFFLVDLRLPGVLGCVQGDRASVGQRQRFERHGDRCHALHAFTRIGVDDDALDARPVLATTQSPSTMGSASVAVNFSPDWLVFVESVDVVKTAIGRSDWSV